MRTFIITIVYKNQAKGTIRIDAKNESNAENVAFDLADKMLGLNSESEKSEVELFFVNNPRHQILFKDIA